MSRCLNSIKTNLAKNFDTEVIVVDNFSTDGSAERAAEKFPWVKVIKNKKNAGFAAANNIGVKNSSGNYLLFANPDIEILPRSIDLMMGHLKNNSDLAAVAPQIISEDGSIYPSC